MKKIIALILAISFISAINAQYLKLNEDKSSSKLYQNYEEENVKEPVIAGELSFIVPGFAIGQMYNGQPGKAFIHIGVTAGSFFLFLAGVSGIHFNVGGNTVEDENQSPLGPMLVIASVALFTGNWVWSVVDAVVSANDINKKARLKKYRTLKNNDIKFGIGLDKNLRFKAVVNF
jgi:TM2 domain-containing membrane protein YozV